MEYSGGEAIELAGQIAWTLGRCGPDIVLAVTEQHEIILDLRCGHDCVHSLGYCEAIEIPTDVSDDWPDEKWDEWAAQSRRQFSEQGILL